MKSADKQIDKCLSAACKLQFGTTEREVETTLHNLFQAFGKDSELAYKIQGGEIDILLTDCNVVVEAKQKANPRGTGSSRKNEQQKTQFEQLQRYVVDIQQEACNNRPWIGILTDATNWYAWEWPKSTNPDKAPKAKKLNELKNINSGKEQELGRWLEDLLSRKDLAGPRWIPRNITDIFAGEQNNLEQIYGNHANDASVKNKREIWLDLLRGSGLAPSEEDSYNIHRLFIRHTYLVAISRAAIGALTEDTSDDDPETALNDGFVSWILEDPVGIHWARRVYDEAFKYDWRARAQDVLRKFYASVIPKEQRKLYGEYYTPDWVAQMLAEKVLDKEWLEKSIQAALTGSDLYGIGVLDPACGSGTFLYHTAKRLLTADALKGHSPQERADAVAKLVHGIDIHPVAVEMARATLLRALPAEPTNGSAALHIAQGDSLLASGADKLYSGEIRLPNEKKSWLIIPKEFVLLNDYRQRTEQLVKAAKDGKKEPPQDALATLGPQVAQKMLEQYKKLVNLCQQRGNGIWTWLIVNAVAPLRLQARKVNRILTNPPWVCMYEIQVEERKRQLEEMFRAENLWVGGRNAHRTDIGSLFVKRSRNAYLQISNAISAWVLNHSSIQGGNWEKFRSGIDAGNTEVIDFKEVKAQPFSGAPSCVWIERLPRTHGKKKVQHMKMRENSRISKEQNEPWCEVNEKVYLDDHKEIPSSQSGYMNGNKCAFRKGATIVPYCLVRVKECEITGETAQFSTRASTREPWANVGTKKGFVPRHWILNTVYSDDLFPFCLRKDISKTIIPINPSGVLEDAPETEKYWREADKVYRRYAGKGSNTPQTLLDQIDFSAKLSKQLPLATSKSMVIYNNSGQYLRATIFQGEIPVIQDTALYLQRITSGEANYLATVMNADILQPAFLQARKTDRHFSAHIWREVPIPKFDPKNPLHQKLAALGKEAAKEATRYRDEIDANASQVKISAHIRACLRKSGLANQIDIAASCLLPNQAKREK